MATKQKREPKAPPQVGRPKVEPVPVVPVTPAAITVCANCDITIEDSNSGGILVSHPSRLGSPVSGSFQPGENYGPWLEAVHAQEST